MKKEKYKLNYCGLVEYEGFQLSDTFSFSFQRILLIKKTTIKTVSYLFV